MSSEQVVYAFKTLVGSVNGEFAQDSFDEDEILNSENCSIGAYDLRTDSCLKEKQGNLCEDLFQLLEYQEQQHANSSQTNKNHFSGPPAGDNTYRNSNSASTSEESVRIRSLFPNLRVSDLLFEVLNPLMNDRVEEHKLMPATQDMDANEEVLNDSTKGALSLTLPALQAGRLYAHLLSRPGSLGSGLVDLEPLTALVALIRRLNVECCGREQQALLGQAQANPNESAPSPSKSPPKKRSRQARSCNAISTVAFDEDCSQCHETEYLDDSQATASNEAKTDAQKIFAVGSRVALEVCKIPQNFEFASWSPESREVVLDAILVAFGMSSALMGSNSDIADSDCSSSLTFNMVMIYSQKAFDKSIVGEIDPEKRRNNSIIILRGLLHFLQMKIILPSGERGKMEARKIASKVLIKVMQHEQEMACLGSQQNVAESTPIRKYRDSKIRNSTGTDKNISRSTLMKNRRASFDGGSVPMTSPVLKNRAARHGCNEREDLSEQCMKPSGIPALILSLAQKLATGKQAGLERAVVRKSTVETLKSCLQWMPQLERAHFLKYLLKICHSKVSVHRLVACELIGSILAQKWLQNHRFDDIDEETQDNLPGSPMLEDTRSITLPQALWRVLRGRLTDRISTVRAAAAASLECAMSAIQGQCMQNISIIDEQETDRLLLALRKRASKDETATVRKTAATVLAKILAIQKDKMSDFYLIAICELCQDQSVLIRRAAAESITFLVEEFVMADPFKINETAINEQDSQNKLIEDSWTAWVLPLVLDEDTCLKAVDCFLQVVVLPLVGGDLRKQKVAWRILSNVGSLTGEYGYSKESIHSLQRSLEILGRNDSDLIYNKLLNKTARVAAESLESDGRMLTTIAAAWCLLNTLLKSKRDAKTSDSLKSISIPFSFCKFAWRIFLDRLTTSPSSKCLQWTLQSSLEALSHVAAEMSPSDSKQCMVSLERSLREFALPLYALHSAVAALYELMVKSNPSESLQERVAWGQDIFSHCEDEIGGFIQKASGAGTTNDLAFYREREAKLVRALFTAGEVSVAGFRPEEEEESDELSAHPSKRLQSFIQILVSGDIPGPSKIKVPPTVRAHAFTALGKFCLRDEKLARSSLTILARELHPSISSPNPCVQSNALLILGDLCARYTNMTDRYLPVMASCLQNGTYKLDSFLYFKDSAIVRKNALLLLSSLLLQDFIKWRGLLFHRFLVACSDEDDEVAKLAETVLSGPLLTRYPKLFFNHFVESIFVLNKCTAHQIYMSAAGQGDGGSGIAVGFDGINLHGSAGEARRRSLYQYLLTRLTDEEKIGVAARLAKEVLGCAASNYGDLSLACQGSAPIDESSSFKLLSAWNVLSDTFYILTSKAIKVKKIRNDSENADIDDPNLPNPSRQVTMAKSRLLSKISLKHMMEIILPILCSLKVKLSASCSPLLKNLMDYLLDVFHNYKIEVEEFLANDPTLLQELQYDARNYGARDQ